LELGAEDSASPMLGSVIPFPATTKALISEFSSFFLFFWGTTDFDGGEHLEFNQRQLSRNFFIVQIEEIQIGGVQISGDFWLGRVHGKNSRSLLLCVAVDLLDGFSNLSGQRSVTVLLHDVVREVLDSCPRVFRDLQRCQFDPGFDDTAHAQLNSLANISRGAFRDVVSLLEFQQKLFLRRETLECVNEHFCHRRIFISIPID
jgi:hypothetical protein